MSTPPPGRYDPRSGQYGQPADYDARAPQPGGGGGYPGPQPGGGYPYQQPPQYGGGPGPAGLGGAPAPGAAPGRPAVLVIGLILLIVSTLPVVLAGVAVLILPDVIPLPADIDAQLAGTGATIDTIFTILRVVGAVLLVLAAVFLVFAILAFTGRNWARIVAAVLTVLFVGLLVANFVTSGTIDLITLATLVLAVAGMVLFFVPAANAYYTGRALSR